MSYKKIIALSLFLCVFVTGIVSAEEISLPADAVKISERPMEFGPMKSTFTNYSTSLSKQQLESFFKKELAKSGWQIKKQGLLFFTKNKQYLSISMRPQKNEENKTRFSIVNGDMPTQEAMQASQKEKPDALNFMPIYPKSNQLNLWDTPMGVIAGYKSNDNIQNVISFYKGKMPSYGWMLYNEVPLSVNEKAGLPEGAKKEGLSENMLAGLSNLKSKFFSARLAFKRNAGEICVINFMSQEFADLSKVNQAQQAQGVESPVPPPENPAGKTQILVSYNAGQKIK